MNAFTAIDAANAALASAANGLSIRFSAAARIAAEHADAVDREARYPAEAMAAVKQQGLLGLLVPAELGGDGASLQQVMELCFALGKACSSTGMIVAMHQVKVACIARHCGNNEWQRAVLRRIAREQLLMGSSTTEGMAGGNVRSSAAAVEINGTSFTLVRDASVISYGDACDGVVTTARRAPDAPASEQVLVVAMKPECKLEPTQGWDTLGMRGTCSKGFKLSTTGCIDQILAEPYDRIHTQTMVPFAHLLWGSCWTGIAAGAVERAQIFLRKVGARSGGALPPGASHFSTAKSALGKARALLANTGSYYERISGDEKALASLDFQSAINTLKIEVSELAVEAVMHALQVNGLSGYRADGEFSLARPLRDVLSAPLMIHNERIRGSMANTQLVSPVAPHLHF